MGDEEHGAASEGLKQVETNLPFRGGIEGTGGLIEDQHPRVLQHCPSQGHALALATGEAGAALAHRRVVALGHLHDEVVGAGDPGRAHQLFSGGIGLHHQQVFLDGAVKEERVLGHHTDLAAEGIELHLADVQPVDFDAA